MRTNKVKVLLSAVVVMLMAWQFSSCSKKNDATPPVDKSSLTTAITAANTLVTSTHEGVAAGDYLKGSQAPYIAAIAAAQVVADDAAATKDQVTAATANLAAATLAYQANLVTAIDPDNLIGQWTFDEIGTAAVGASVKDYSGNGHNGAMKAGPASKGSIVPALGEDRYGNPGKALLLDKGANVEIPYATALNPATLSISAWVKLSEVRNNRFIGLHSWLGYKFEVQDGNRPFASVFHNATNAGTYDRDSGVAIDQDTWYHLVVTYTAGTMIFYINSESIITWEDVPDPAAAIATPYNLVLGQDFPTDKYSQNDGTNFDVVGNPDYHVIPEAWGGYLHGSLDEVRIYKSVLTQAQVTAIYNLEKP